MRRCLAALVLPVLALSLALFQPDPAQAARGGRIGGGSFRAPSPSSSPSIQRGGGGYSGYSGGIGFPFLIPIFGFGGGGLFGFLILMAAVGFLVNAMRGGANILGDSREKDDQAKLTRQSVTITQLQVGLLSSARALQDDMRRLAAAADTTSTSGLQRVLQETTLALLRQPDLWVYANAEIGSVPFASAESAFNQIAMAERSKLLSEITVNVAGRQPVHSTQLSGEAGEADATNEYIVITVILASQGSLQFDDKVMLNSENLRSILQLLGSTPASDLVALEVIWQPDGRGDVLSTDELVTAYPQLQHL